MVNVNKKWIVKEADLLLKNLLAQQLHISPVLAQILLHRGLYTPEEAAKFLFADLASLHDPFLLQDMDRAVERILSAVRRQEKILVYGDYDTDGITGATLLIQALKQLGGVVGLHIPNRLKKGYGLHLEPVIQASNLGFKLIITVDCGISGAEVVNRAKSAGGPDFIITDHHQVGAELPPALAVINPKRTDCPYPCKDLAGVGVALKLIQALFQESPELDHSTWQDYLDLVCLGTVADLVPLQGENRLFVKYGLPKVAKTNRPGLKALIKIAGIKSDEKLGTREISFGLAPRLNASGRMGDALNAVKLLLCENPEIAGKIAAELEKTNQQRQELEQVVFQEAINQCEQDPRQKHSKILCLASPAFHPGVTGIVASRLVEIFRRPAILVFIQGEQGKGSGRSIPGFHLHDALGNCQQHLISYGGHAQAAGFTLKTNELENFRQSLNEYAKVNLPEELLLPQIKLDAITSLTEISPQLVNELNLLLPFGPGNPEPLLGCLGAEVLRLRKVGRKENHLKMFVKENGAAQDGIGFYLADQLVPEITAGKMVNLAFIPVLEQYRGQTRIQLEIKDICPVSVLPNFTNKHPVPQKGLEQKIANELIANELPGRSPELLKEIGAPLPEFAWTWFKKYKQFPGHLFLPSPAHPADGWPWNSPPASPEAAASGCTVQNTSGNLKITDSRNLPGKLSRLVNLIAGNKRTVVLVNCPYQTLVLANCLNRAGVRAAFFHPLFKTHSFEDIPDSFSSGEAQTLITTTSSLAQLPPERKIEQLIIYHLPFNRQEWLLILNYAQNTKAEEILLFFGHADRQDMEHYLASLAPDRNCLAILYILIQHWETKNKKIASNLAHFALALRRRGLFWVQEHTINIALAIFYELGLLKKEREIYLAQAPGQKLDVRNSPTFSWGEKEKKQNINWYEELLTMPAREIISSR